MTKPSLLFKREETLKAIQDEDATVAREYFYSVDQSMPDITPALYKSYVRCYFDALDKAANLHHHHSNSFLNHWKYGAKIIDSILLFEGRRLMPARSMMRMKVEQAIEQSKGDPHPWLPCSYEADEPMKIGTIEQQLKEVA